MFESLKMRTNINYKPKEINYVTIEGKERDSFNQVLIEYLDKYLYIEYIERIRYKTAIE